MTRQSQAAEAFDLRHFEAMALRRSSLNSRKPSTCVTSRRWRRHPAASHWRSPEVTCDRRGLLRESRDDAGFRVVALA